MKTKIDKLKLENIEHRKLIGEANKMLQKQNSKLETTKKQRESDKKQFYTAIRKLDNKIKLIQESYDSKLKPIYKEIDRIQGWRTNANESIEENTNQIEILQAKQSGKINTISARIILTRIGVKLNHVLKEGERKSKYWNEFFELKKELDNGIVVLRNINYDGLRYFAFEGFKLVGYWSKRKSEHRGDYNSSDAWINVTTLDMVSSLQHKENNRVEKLLKKQNIKGDSYEKRRQFTNDNYKYYRKTSGRYQSSRKDVTTKQFLKQLSEIKNPKKLKSVNLKSKSNIDTLNKHSY